MAQIMSSLLKIQAYIEESRESLKDLIIKNCEPDPEGKVKSISNLHNLRLMRQNNSMWQQLQQEKEGAWAAGRQCGRTLAPTCHFAALWHILQ